MPTHISFISYSLLASLIISSATAADQCPPLGPVFPAPRQPSTNDVVQTVLKDIDSQFHKLTSTSTYHGTALSVGISSIYEDSPMFSYQHTPKSFNESGTHNVTIETVFRLASISKMYTALAMMQLSDQINLLDPVTKYVPQLLDLDQGQDAVNGITRVNWSEVTIDALLSQLGGISEDLGDGDLANTPGPWTSLGFPTLIKGESAQCGAEPHQRPCTRSDFFKYYGQKEPVYAPYATPMYSNSGFAILGLVIEAVTNTTYADYMQENVFGPLGLEQTTVGVPSDFGIGFIPAGKTWWSTDLGFYNPSGGLYASTRDLLRVGESILKFQALSPAATRHWLKPATFTSSIGTFVGRPWEIVRSDNVTSDKRVVDFYSKSGNLYDYSSIVVLVPDYGLVMTVISSGPQSGALQVEAILSKIVWTLLPAVEAAGKAEARQRYPGKYEAKQGDKTTATIELSIDDGPGLLVTNYTSQGKNMAATYAKVTDSTVRPEIRMYPTDLKASNGTSEQVAWRAVYNTIPDPGAVNSLLFFPQGSCQTWSVEDELSYGLRALDDFVITLASNNGQAQRVEARVLRVVMQKTD